MVLSVIPVMSVSAAEIIKNGSCGESSNYVFYDDGKLEISGSGSIGDYMFSAEIFSENVLEIKKVEIGRDITCIGNGAFYKCQNIEEVLIPADSKLEEIDGSAFEFCYSLAKIKLPESLTYIGNYAFNGDCLSGELYIPKGVSKEDVKNSRLLNYGYSEIKVHEENEDFCLENGVLFSKDKKEILKYPEENKDEKFEIPSCVDTVCYNCFYGNDFIKTLIYPESINHFSETDIYACPNLLNLVFFNNQCEIEEPYGNIPNYIIFYGYTDSTAQTYADSSGKKFIAIRNGKYCPEFISGTPETCTENGIKDYYRCIRTGKLFLDEECTNEITENDLVIKAAHKWDDGTVITKPTCVDKGVKLFTCTVCEATKTEEIAALGHTWDKGIVTKEPTCTEDGEKTYTCSACGTTKTEVIAAAGHTPGEWITDKEPTCTENGLRIKKCTVCHETLETEEIAATGHTDADGDGFCDNCGENLNPDADDGEGMWFPFRTQILSFLERIIRFFLKLVADMGYVI